MRYNSFPWHFFYFTHLNRKENKHDYVNDVIETQRDKSQ